VEEHPYDLVGWLVHLGVSLSRVTGESQWSFESSSPASSLANVAVSSSDSATSSTSMRWRMTPRLRAEATGLMRYGSEVLNLSPLLSFSNLLNILYRHRM